ncbi:hypothetical protein ACSS6W_008809 [Trichoderma asperelloides]
MKISHGGSSTNHLTANTVPSLKSHHRTPDDHGCGETRAQKISAVKEKEKKD